MQFVGKSAQQKWPKNKGRRRGGGPFNTRTRLEKIQNVSQQTTPYDDKANQSETHPNPNHTDHNAKHAATLYLPSHPTGEARGGGSRTLALRESLRLSRHSGRPQLKQSPGVSFKILMNSWCRAFTTRENTKYS